MFLSHVGISYFLSTNIRISIAKEGAKEITLTLSGHGIDIDVIAKCAWRVSEAKVSIRAGKCLKNQKKTPRRGCYKTCVFELPMGSYVGAITKVVVTI